ncbi:MAG: hypothetical protein HY699_04035 [Deltaproteobacteria bacterium]|nr:hypothetical protein [Deltaproteobacteria bacterium]
MKRRGKSQLLSLRVLLLAMAVFAACGGHGGSGPGTPTSTRTNFAPTPTNTPLPTGVPTNTSGPTQTPTPDSLQARRQFRALAGVSMRAYGAMNLGAKQAELFGTIAALSGPIDMRQLLRDMVNDNLEVRPQTAIPTNVGDDFTFDHQAPYPGRDTRLSMVKDLVIAFGNPFLQHPDPSRQFIWRWIPNRQPSCATMRLGTSRCRRTRLGSSMAAMPTKLACARRMRRQPSRSMSC